MELETPTMTVEFTVQYGKFYPIRPPKFKSLLPLVRALQWDDELTGSLADVSGKNPLTIKVNVLYLLEALHKKREA